MCFCQAADFADRVASGVLTADVAAKVESSGEHADAVWEMSAAESKNRRLAEKVAAMEAEKTDLWRQLAEERREANQAIAEAQAARAEAKVARAEGSLTSNAPRSWRQGSTPCAVAWTRPRPRRARKSSGCTHSSWTRTASWVRGLLTSKYPTEN
jgi:hypothetical protein